MRERFQDDISDIFYEIPKTGRECSNNKQKVLDFIEQEIKKDREELVEMIEKLSYTDEIDKSRPIIKGFEVDYIINIIKNRV